MLKNVLTGSDDLAPQSLRAIGYITPGRLTSYLGEIPEEMNWFLITKHCGGQTRKTVVCVRRMAEVYLSHDLHTFFEPGCPWHWIDHIFIWVFDLLKRKEMLVIHKRRNTGLGKCLHFIFHWGGRRGRKAEKSLRWTNISVNVKSAGFILKYSSIFIVICAVHFIMLVLDLSVRARSTVRLAICTV